MSKWSRRRLVTAAVAGTAGVSGVAAAARMAERYGLVPPDSGGLYGAGHTLTYGAQRLLGKQALAREFRRDQISEKPFANGPALHTPEYQRLQADGFAAWRLTIEGMVKRPASLAPAELRAIPASSQITHMACEEGWSYIAEWTGAPLAHLLFAVGVLPEARYVLYSSMEEGWSDSIDMADALHPQTLVAYGMNGRDLPPEHGGPLRLRVARQLGYKNVKYVTRLVVTDSLKGSFTSSGYSWYAGI